MAAGGGIIVLLVLRISDSSTCCMSDGRDIPNVHVKSAAGGSPNNRNNDLAPID
jgi:hypothetical protein